MKKIMITAMALFISAISMAQVKPTSTSTNAELTKCNCGDLKVNVYLYKESGTTNYIARLDYFNNRTSKCTPVLKTLNIHRGGADMITVPLSALELINASNGKFIYRIKRAQLRTDLLLNVEYVLRYAIDYGIILKPCPVVNKTVKLEEGEPIL